MERRRLLLMLVLGSAAAPCSGQRLVAYVPVAEATTSGALLTSGGKSLLGETSVVTALQLPAHVTLSRGGALLVCQTGVVHLTAGQSSPSKSGKSYDPLLIALERGALEISMPMLPSDTVATPDMRFSSAGHDGKPAPVDLAMSVSANGDTCVESRSRKSPTLNIHDAFGKSTYLLKPGQHVLFQHGLIQEAVEGGTTSCGCPPVSPDALSLADAALRAGAGNAPTFNRDGSAFPFPGSQGDSSSLLPPDRPEQVPVHVAATLAFDARADLPPPPPDPLFVLDPTPYPLKSLDDPDATPGRRKLAFIPPAHIPAPPPAVAANHLPPAPARPGPASIPGASLAHPGTAAASAPAPAQPPAPSRQPAPHTLGRFFKRIFGH